MNKRELAVEVGKRAAVDMGTALRVIEAMTKVVTETVAADEEVSIVNFGTFRRVPWRARKGNNFHTGETIEIKARNLPKFVAAQAFRKATNGEV